jgi:hypothetical protein
LLTSDDKFIGWECVGKYRITIYFNWLPIVDTYRTLCTALVCSTEPDYPRMTTRGRDAKARQRWRLARTASGRGENGVRKPVGGWIRVPQSLSAAFCRSERWPTEAAGESDDGYFRTKSLSILTRQRTGTAFPSKYCAQDLVCAIRLAVR